MQAIYLFQTSLVQDDGTMRNLTLALILVTVFMAALIIAPAVVLAQQRNNTIDTAYNDCPNDAEGYTTMHGENWEAHHNQMHNGNGQSYMGGMMGRQGTAGFCH